jgi:protein O-GlcNAc transferase
VPVPLRLRRGSALLLVALFAAAAAAQIAPPPLPRLPLNTYPASIRDSIARAYRDATARSSDADAVGNLARLLHAWEQWDGAHHVYVRAEALAPRVFDWHYLDAIVLQRLARHQEASARLREAIAISPGYLPARVKLAEALFESGNLQDSETLFNALLLEPAGEPAAHFGLGRIAATAGRHEAAVTHFQQAVALFPEWGAAHYALALSLRAIGRRDEAQRALERHAQFGALWPAVEDGVLARVDALRDDAGANLRRGQKLADSGEVAGAISEYEKALERDPSLTIAHANLIKLYGRAKDWEKAEAHYRAAVEQDPNAADVHYDYGVLLGLQSKWDSAAEAYGRAIAINPLYAEAHNNLGQVFERKRELDAALDAYRRAIAAQPTFRLARFNVGRMLVALGRPAEAIGEFEKLLQPRDTESPRYIFALAVAHIRAGHRDEGTRWATEARRLATEYGQHEFAAAIDRELAALK